MQILSYTEENYLKAIFKLSENHRGNVSTNSIANEIATSAASVTDMLKRLSEKKFLHYQKYRGVYLTDSGKSMATQLIRKHRLWEVFLVDKLQFDWADVHEIAEELEHIQSQQLVDRLEQFLGYPKFDPHGDPIPNAAGRFTIQQRSPLATFAQGKKVQLLGVSEHSKEFLAHLDSLHITLGTSLLIIKHNTYDQSVVVVVDDDEEKLLTSEVAYKLLVDEIP